VSGKPFRLNSDVFLLPELLVKGGYTTKMFGHWQLGVDLPTTRGFQGKPLRPPHTEKKQGRQISRFLDFTGTMGDEYNERSGKVNFGGCEKTIREYNLEIVRKASTATQGSGPSFIYIDLLTPEREDIPSLAEGLNILISTHQGALGKDGKFFVILMGAAAEDTDLTASGDWIPRGNLLLWDGNGMIGIAQARAFDSDLFATVVEISRLSHLVPPYVESRVLVPGVYKLPASVFFSPYFAFFQTPGSSSLGLVLQGKRGYYTPSSGSDEGTWQMWTIDNETSTERGPLIASGDDLAELETARAAAFRCDPGVQRYHSVYHSPKRSFAHIPVPLEDLEAHIRPLPSKATYNTDLWPAGKIPPSVFILGTPKGGTTSIFDWLTTHPQVAFQELKEPNFFTSSHQKGLEWYARMMPTRTEGKFISIDGTVRALGWCEAPGRIQAYSEAFHIRPKFIITLRDPVERIFSHHLMRVLQRRNYRVELDTMLMRSVNLLDACLKNHTYEESIRDCYCLQVHPNHLLDSTYDFHIARYQSLFPKEDFFITSLSELASDPTGLMDRITAFLDLPPHDYSTVTADAHNTNKRSTRVRTSFEKELKEYFAAVIENTEALTGISLSNATVYKSHLNKKATRRVGLSNRGDHDILHSFDMDWNRDNSFKEVKIETHRRDSP